MHDISYTLMGVILLIHPTKASPLTTGLLGSLLLLAGLSTSWLSMRRRQLNQPNDYWLLLSSGRNTLFGVMLLANLGKALPTVINLLGMWAILYAFLQALEAMFYFLGTRTKGGTDFEVQLIHVLCVLISGGFAFVLLMQPVGIAASLRFVGLFLIVLGIIQSALTQRLKATSA
ncbi:hypothetical protein GCM10028808_56710 [Spirosoma migulaei]